MTVTHRVQAERFGAFKNALKERGLKSTSQRDDIARVFFASNRHISVEELYREVRKINPRVGYATVYRTVRLLRECGLAAERHFHDGEARFENVEEELHHDHLICERCGRIVEFSNSEIEELQERVAHKLDFVISGHKMELYGICGECRTGRAPRRAGRGEPHVYRT
ncbi:MAG: transcriptional repressor [Deltaproteobacteria bacterium]|nr:transcriptional repressor [Deltaproteobacteria bacterium]